MNQRNDVVDIMKGIAIICVMIGHTDWCPYWLYVLIFSFHIPLFFIISGYYSKGSEGVVIDRGGYIRKSARRLLLPYAIVACAVCLYSAFRAHHYGDCSIVIHEVAKYIFAWDAVWEGTIFDLWDGPTWFLLSLFWARLLFEWLRAAGRWFIPICIALSVTMILLHPYVPTPFGIGRGIQALMLMAIGYAYKRYQLPAWLKIIAVACWPISMWLGDIDMYGYHYNCLPVDILGACGGTLVIYQISKQWTLWAKSLRHSFFHSFVAWCGRNSLVILCAHSIEMSVTMIHVITKLFPLEVPSVLYSGIKHGVTLLGAWGYVKLWGKHKEWRAITKSKY